MGELTASSCRKRKIPVANVSGMMVLCVAALVSKFENDVRIWYKPIYLNLAGLPVETVR